MTFERLGKLLSSAVAVVVCVFAVFGGVLSNIAPPVANVATKVGLASFVLLALLLLIALWSKDRIGSKYNKVAIVVGGICLAIGIALWLCYDRVGANYIFTYPPPPSVVSTRYIRGELTESGKKVVGNGTVSEAIMDNGGLAFVTGQQLLWTESSQRDVEFGLTALYMLFVSLLGTAVFCFLVRLVDPQTIPKPSTRRSTGTKRQRVKENEVK